MSKVKVLFAGIGAVGGYFGGLLANNIGNRGDVYFLSRGENLKQIKSKGLVVHDDDSKHTIHPFAISDNVQDFEEMDYIFLCTKTYHLNDIVSQIKPCTSQKTVIVPLHNGVNSRKVISKFYPSNLITDGCVFIFSRLAEPGLVIKKGSVAKLSFGLDKFQDHRLEKLHEILVKASIDSVLSQDIKIIIWEKFIFLSSIATATSYFDCNIHHILQNVYQLNSLKKTHSRSYFIGNCKQH